MRVSVLGVSVLALTTCADATGEGDLGAAEASLAAGARVLLVVGNTTLSAADTALRARLVALQATVVVEAAAAAQAGDASGKALVVITDSVASSDVNTKFRDTAVPVLCLKAALFDDMRFTGTTSGTSFGTTSGQTDLALVAVSHPIAVGLTVPVVTSGHTFNWGVPGSAAAIIAALSGNASRAAIFAYDLGQAMVGGTAAGRRVAFFAGASAPTALTTQGGKLFDNSVQWLTAACGAGTHSCNGACVSNASVTSCGTSCTACVPPANGVATCNGTACGFACAAGFHLCGTACVANGSVATCGLSCTACPTPSGGTATCDGTVCSFVCGTGLHVCSGTCVSNTAPTSCGTSCTACVPPANGVATCNGTTCGFSCTPGFHLCGATCVSNTSVGSCGTISCTACPGPANATATCDGTACGFVCNSGFKPCGATCIPSANAC